MNTNISIQKHDVTYNAKDKIFTVSAKNIQFAITYHIINDITNKSVKFELSHSTGSEWDPNTVWVHTSTCKKYILHMLNDDVTPQHAERYLNAKLKN